MGGREVGEDDAADDAIDARPFHSHELLQIPRFYNSVMSMGLPTQCHQLWGCYCNPIGYRCNLNYGIALASPSKTKHSVRQCWNM